MLYEKAEKMQNSAALGASGAWRGTTDHKILQELGWDNLYQRR